jgi:hypothetical protein
MKLDARTIELVEEALREIAVLFIALAPLDVFLGEDGAYVIRNGLIFVWSRRNHVCRGPLRRKETTPWMIF